MSRTKARNKKARGRRRVMNRLRRLVLSLGAVAAFLGAAGAAWKNN
jgi:hypothetical protein